MIDRLSSRNALDVVEFVNRVNDRCQDFYFTKDKRRIFLTDLKIVSSVLQTQEIYALIDGEIKALLLIYREKGYRPFIKILSDTENNARNIIKFLIWNFSDKDLYIKVKKYNYLSKLCQRYGFIFNGNRGEEILLFRKGERKIVYQMKDKEDID
jgi:hypothetical protein